MNLLTDSWIPVTEQGRFRHIPYKSLLCSDTERSLCLPRDDMELAALQMIVSLTQAIFTPKDKAELMERTNRPMDEKCFNEGILPFSDWFVLDHPKTPFMQCRNIKGKAVTLQKLFIGLPEKYSTSPFAHAFFNQTDEIEHVCPSCTSIAIFQQSQNGVSLGGSSFSVGLKGASPVTTLIRGKYLREDIWFNILSKTFIEQNMQGISLNGDKNMPVWISKVKNNEPSHEIGILRGLFWQPAKMELLVDNSENHNCDVCGSKYEKAYSGFIQEPGLCKIKGFWRHPHSPVFIGKQMGYIKFKGEENIWHQFLGFFYENRGTDKKDEGYSPALTVTQYRQTWRNKKIHLSVGGYATDKKSIEKITGRKHEYFSLPEQWEDNFDQLSYFVNSPLQVSVLLDNAVKFFGRKIFEKDKPRKKEAQMKKGLRFKAKSLFFSGTEPLIHAAIREMDFETAWDTYKTYEKSIHDMAVNIFSQVTEPFKHDPRMIGPIARYGRSLSKKLREVRN